MSPQRPGFKRGIWKNLESLVRNWAIDNDEMVVVTGPVLFSWKTGFSVKDTKIIVELFLEEIQNSLVEGKYIEIRGFGTFLE